MSEVNKINLDHLRCEYRVQPIGIDERKPRLSWTINAVTPGLTQAAYRLQVACDPAGLAAGNPDLWDSGKVYSGNSIQVEYNGIALASLMQCFWRVKVWCMEEAGAGEEMEADWSAVSHWSMGLLDGKDWYGSWIAGDYEDFSGPRVSLNTAAAPEFIDREADAGTAPAVMFRSEAVVEKGIKRATAFICGLGYYVFHINGDRIGDHQLDPVFTDYSTQVNYIAYDVTANLAVGKNCVGAILGNGFYNFTGADLFQFEKAHWRTSPKLLLNIFIELDDGTMQVIYTDSTWKWSTGDITYNCIRGGETIDKRLAKEGWSTIACSCDDWNNVQLVPAPPGKLVSQYVYPIRVRETILPVHFSEPVENAVVFDFGRNLTGWIRLKATGAPGQRLDIRFSEKLGEAGLVDTEYSSSHTFGRFQRGIFILSGKAGEVYEPHFTYHGFRYVQITGLSESSRIDGIAACNVHTDLPQAGQFSCSNERLNQLQASVVRTLLDSIHGMPAEEPTREKMGWNQDAQNTAEAYMYNFDSAAAYIKYIHDILDAQETNGHIPPIIPTNGWGLVNSDGSPIKYDDPWWGASLAVLVNHVYRYYGDFRILGQSYNAMKAYVDYLSTTAKGYILDWSLGDWLDHSYGADGSGMTPVEQTSTAAYYYLSRLLSQNASMLNMTEDAKRYGLLADSIRDAFNQSFLDMETGAYCKNSQTAQVLPLYTGIAPENRKHSILSNLLDEIAKSGYHVTSGFVGVMPLVNFLSEAGFINEVYAAVTQETGTGWMYMVKDGLSTLGENLNPDGYGSQHHPFAACIGSWLYGTLAGIKPDISFPGFKRILIKPEIPEDLDWVKGEYHSVHGKIISQWEKQGDRLAMKVTVPVNTTALVYVPLKEANDIEAYCISEKGKEPIGHMELKSNKAVFSVASGDYVFISGNSSKGVSDEKLLS